MSYRGRRVLVTGADGFIGSHLAEALVRENAEVTALALYNAFDRYGWLDEVDGEARASMTLVRGDIRDGVAMHRLAEGHDVVFHLAALIGIPYSYDSAQSYIDVNVTGTLNILEAARAHEVGRVVHTSTSEVYGTAQTQPIAEHHPLVAQSPYAASKIAADKLAESYALAFELPIAILRPFNTYGPRQSERAVIPTVIRQALDPACDAISIGDTAPTRDFNYVADTVSAFLLMGEADRLDYGRAYNTGTGTAVSVGAMIDLVRAATGTNKPVNQEQSRFRPENSEVRALIADSRALRAATGWAPKTELKSGIGTTVAWWRDRFAKNQVRAGAHYMV
jgi:NAD dependent epimerase/dehydratase